MSNSRINIGEAVDYSPELGACVQAGEKQIAVFYLPNTKQQWFAVDNLNPQNDRTVLSRGIVGSEGATPYVACPLHKYRYSLVDGSCLTDEQYSIDHYQIEEVEGNVFLSV